VRIKRAEKRGKLVWQNNFYDLKQMCDENGKRIPFRPSPLPPAADVFHSFDIHDTTKRNQLKRAKVINNFQLLFSDSSG
jgi:hypothetical protein